MTSHQLKIFVKKITRRNHLAMNKQKAISLPKRIRRVRIEARRQREIMAIIANEENGESAEWIDEDYLKLNETTIPPEKKKSCSAHLFIE